MPMKHWNEEFKKSAAGQAASSSGGSGARQPAVDILRSAYERSRRV